MKNPTNHQVRAIAAGALAAGIALVAWVIYALLADQAVMLDVARSTTANLAQLLEEHTHQSLRRVELRVQQASENLKVIKTASPSAREVIRQRLFASLSADGLIHGFYVYDKNAQRIISAAIDDELDLEAANTLSYLTSKPDNRAPVLGLNPPVKGKTRGRYLLPVVSRLTTASGESVGYVVATIDMDYFQRFYRAIELRNNGFVTLFLRDGWIAARMPFDEALMRRQWLDSPMFRDHLPRAAHNTVRQTVVADGIERIYSYRALKEYPAVVAVGITLTEALTDWRRRVWRDGLLLALSLIALTTAAWLLIRHQRHQQAVEQALRDSAERSQLYTSAVMQSSNAMWMHDLDGVVNMWNASAERIFGFGAEEVLGKSLRSSIFAGMANDEWETIRKGFSEKLPEIHEARRATRDGQVLDLFVSTAPVFDLEGKYVARIVSMADITEKKNIERQYLQYRDEQERLNLRLISELREARDAAEAASNAKTLFLATVSHEIRTPMNGVLGMTELLLGTKLDADQRDLAQTAYDSGATLLAIINDILDFTSIEAGHLELIDRPFEPFLVVQDICKLLSPEAKKKNLDLRFNSRAASTVRLLGDEGRVRQIYLNLVGNAIKFTEQGVVEVTLEAAAISAQKMRISFEVRDTGIGIAIADQAALFAPFTQVDSSYRRRFGGTGLGLSICKRLVDAMGGQIGMTSAPGAGTTMTVVLDLEIARGVA